LTTEPSRFVTARRIVESPLSFECERYVVLGVGDKAEVILGKVLAMHITDEAVLMPNDAIWIRRSWT
jgi:flavin reductase (DIM6/NTAB) family NADH-FMN oxidoreductase RutF